VRAFAIFAFALLCTPALATPLTRQEQDTMKALLGWAVKLSSYSMPERQPTVEFEPQSFFDEHACHGRHCHVWGWYPNTGKDVVYVLDDVRALLDDGSDPRSLLAASIVVHEFVHYLQAESRGFAPYECAQALALEREAYGLQSQYLMSYGRYVPVGISMHGATCGGAAAGERRPG
jgi:hypothetical protein